MAAERAGRRVVALAGGVGAARFLAGLVRVVPPEDVSVIVNTGDDRRFYGVHVSPDVDIVTYTLAGRVDRSRGYGLQGDTTAVIEMLDALGHETWFRLGDRDFAVCQHRTQALAQGIGLTRIADGIRRARGVATRILPMSEDPCPSIVTLGGGRRVHFEEYLARDGAHATRESRDVDRRLLNATSLLDFANRELGRADGLDPDGDMLELHNAAAKA